MNTRSHDRPTEMLFLRSDCSIKHEKAMFVCSVTFNFLFRKSRQYLRDLIWSVFFLLEVRDICVDVSISNC